MILVKRWEYVVLAIVIGLLAAVALPGCSAEQRSGAADQLDRAAAAARTANVQLVGSPTTQPSPIVGVVETVAPITMPWIEVAGTAAGLVGLVLGGFAQSLRTGPKIAALTETATAAGELVSDHRAALSEVVGDIKQFRQPTVPWSPTTAALVAAVAGHTAAAVEPVTTHVSDLTITRAETDPATPKPAATG